MTSEHERLVAELEEAKRLLREHAGCHPAGRYAEWTIAVRHFLHLPPMNQMRGSRQ